MGLRVHQTVSNPGEVTGTSLGAILTVVYSAECKASQKANRPAAMLPILVVLFVFSYSLLTMLVFEQGQTIESQRGLIREMLKDSTQLAALKGKMARDASQHAAEQLAVPTDQKNSGSAAAPKHSDKDAKRPGKSARSTKEAPGKPAADLEDVRRLTRVI
jgi:mannitol-specific phosphotransferase system IIBC component